MFPLNVLDDLVVYRLLIVMKNLDLKSLKKCKNWKFPLFLILTGMDE